MTHAVFLEAPRYAAPINCQHCAGPCIRVCPTAAVLRAMDNSIKIAPMKCSGCQLCIVACPLGIIRFDAGNKIARMSQMRAA